MSIKWSLAIACLILPTACTSNPAEIQKTGELTVREQLEEMAKELVYFSANNFVYGRTVAIKPNRQLRELETLSEYEKELPVILTQEVADQYYERSKRIVRKLSTHRWNETDLIEMLDHPDAKVRTLAAAALFATDNPNNVLSLAKLLRDDSPTFPSPPYFQESDHHTHGELFRQTVAHVAVQLVGPYMHENFMFDAILNRKSDVVTNVKNHFSTREGPAAICRDFEIWRRRAWGEPTDSAEETNERLKRVREHLMDIPMPDRAWYAMAIGGSYLDIDQRQQQLLSDDSIVELARNVGHENLMRAVLLQLEPTEMFLQPVPSGSPRRNFEEGRLRTIRDFILQNASRLLQPSDADQLLTLAAEAKSTNYGDNFSRFTVAAAELQPDRAIEILHAAFAALTKFQPIKGSDPLAISLWTKGGLSERDFLVDWFYFEAGASTSRNATMASFLSQAAKISDPDGRLLIASIIKDRRLSMLDSATTYLLVRIVNRRLNPPWFNPTDTRSIENSFLTNLSNSIICNQRMDKATPLKMGTRFADANVQWQARLRHRIAEYEQASAP